MLELESDIRISCEFPPRIWARTRDYTVSLSELMELFRVRELMDIVFNIGEVATNGR